MIAALSVPELCLSFYFVCDDQIQISCAVQNGESSRDLTTRLAVGCWLGKRVSTLIGYLSTDGLNCLTVKYLASWHLE